MIDENRYEWEVYYNGVLLGRTTTEGRFQLVKEKIADVSIPLIEFRVVLKQMICPKCGTEVKDVTA
jgi:hypothetical protein